MSAHAEVAKGLGSWTSVWHCSGCDVSARYGYITSEEQAIEMSKLYFGLHQIQIHGA
jgi:hypothetical protein